MIEMKAELERV